MRLPPLASLLLLGCSVELSLGEVESERINTCQTNDDCQAGACRSGACVAAGGEIDVALLEITPPDGVQPTGASRSVGGSRLVEIVSDLSSARDDLVLDLPELSHVQGFVKSYDRSVHAPCVGDLDTLPVRVTLVPHERSFGLPALSYQATADLTIVHNESGPCRTELQDNDLVYEFGFDVPAGDYALYLERAENAAYAEECRIAPAALESTYSLAAGQVCLVPPLPEPERVEVVIEWPGKASGARSLEGWFLDVVHPTTGRRLSERTELRQADATELPAGGVEYRFPNVQFTTATEPGTELVRLSPPDGTVAPVIQLERSALTAATSNVARIANLREFPAPVRLQAWVLKAAGYDTGQEAPVQASVTLTATKLDGVDPGIFASFQTSADVGADGRLDVVIMPGEYRVRVVPAVGTGLSAFETTLLAPCSRLANPDQCVPRSSSDPAVVQAGKTLLVPPAATVLGRVTSPLGAGSGTEASVVGLPGMIRSKKCVADASAECVSTAANVLDIALGDDAFVPRSVSDLVERGRFALSETDCGLCKEGEGAVFDFFLEPADGSGYPWAVRPGVLVDGDVDLGAVDITLPVLRQGSVQIAQAGASLFVPGALVRVYVLRDQFGEVLSDPAAPPCGERASDPAAPCVRSLLQVAETRADSSGRFRLFLPSVLP